jgi:hypothetical protein
MKISSDTRFAWRTGTFFAEKSRRRAETARLEERRNQLKLALATAVVIVVALGGIIGLAMLP